MAKSQPTNIRFDGCEMIVIPVPSSMNRLKPARKLTEAISEAMDQPRPDLITDLVVDLEQVASISSVGLNELIQIQKRSRASGIVMRLRSLNDNLRDVFHITRLERIFQFDSGGSPSESEPIKTLP